MINTIYKYPKTQNLYRVINVAMMKCPITRDWVSCIIYEEHKKYDSTTEIYKIPNNPIVFVREEQDFLTKFKLM